MSSRLRTPHVGAHSSFALAATIAIAGCSGGGSALSSVPSVGAPSLSQAQQVAPVANGPTLAASASDATIATSASAAMAASSVLGNAVSTLAAGPTISLREYPSPAESFVESFGFDSQFGSDSEDQRNIGALLPRLVSLGVKSLRDGYATSGHRFDELSAHGIKHSISFAVRSMTPDAIKGAIAAQGGAKNIGFVETDNEPDNAGNANWARDAVAGQKMLYQTIHSTPGLGGIYVLAPPLALMRNASTLGNVYADAGNIHNGTCNFNPGTTINGADALAFLKTEQQYVTPGRPVWTTETGYDDDTRSSCYLSQDLAAKYVPRTIAYRFSIGIPRSYFDTLTDHPNQSNFAYLGFLTASGQPKKQYYATASMLNLLADDGKVASSSPLSYAISGQTNDVSHVLLRKSDGSYYLLMWVEEPSWIYRSYDKKGVIVNPSQNVTVSFSGKQLGGVKLYTYQPDYSLKVANTAADALTGAARTSMSLKISDSVSIVHFNAM